MRTEFKQTADVDGWPKVACLLELIGWEFLGPECGSEYLTHSEAVRDVLKMRLHRIVE